MANQKMATLDDGVVNIPRADVTETASGVSFRYHDIDHILVDRKIITTHADYALEERARGRCAKTIDCGVEGWVLCPYPVGHKGACMLSGFVVTKKGGAR